MIKQMFLSKTPHAFALEFNDKETRDDPLNLEGFQIISTFRLLNQVV